MGEIFNYILIHIGVAMAEESKEVQDISGAEKKSQNEPIDTGLQCLLAMANMHSIPADEKKLKHEYGTNIFDRQKILLAAKDLGMTAKAVKQDLKRLRKAPLPAVGEDKNGAFFLLARISVPGEDSLIKDDDIQEATPDQWRILLQYPGDSPIVVNIQDFEEFWNGTLLFFVSSASYSGALAKFDFTWFIPAIIRYRKILLEIVIISFFLQIITIITPLFFQVVMDKVLANNALQTLNVIAIGLLAVSIYEVLLGGIRTWVFNHTSSKLDVELGARLFRHLLSLPMAYFHARRVGDSVARVRELENIRHFLTSNAVTLILDIFFSVVIIAVMFLYSPKLTWVVLGSIPLYFLVSFVYVPIIRKRLDDKFNKGAENQSFLVESISGIDTIKALAIEPRWNEKWDKTLTKYAIAGLGVSNIGVFASSFVTLISKLVGVAILWIGATEVLEQRLSLGELIAFNMLQGQVANPILRLAQLWNDFQQVGISVSRLGDILNTTPEIEGQKTRLPRLDGSIKVENVSFRYRPDSSDVLTSINIDISPGEVIGIVGRSGSGKSTLTKLIQRLFVPDRGRILIDGQDIAVIDTTSLRQQIGVVLQENFLFNRSVRDNIAVNNPAIAFESILHVAKLAGAHDFVCELAEGYDTIIGEHGVGLSGGQRQRIAIARALITDPRILIFDEATSALDYESEKIIQDNMKNICLGRTVIIIAHRLTAVRNANRIVVLEKGKIAEVGAHQELMELQNGIYRHLYNLQQGGIAS